MRFTLNGERLELIAEDVQDRLRNVSPSLSRSTGSGSASYCIR
jgi:hypothetical protein